MVTAYLPPELIERLDAAAVEQGTTRSGYLRWALIKSLEGDVDTPAPPSIRKLHKWEILGRDTRPGSPPSSRSEEAKAA
jgi:hypothetical protein